MGRPDGAGGQLRAGVDGLQDFRFWRRARGYLGAGRGHVLGDRERVAGRQALQRRARTRKSAGRGADGADLREPGGAEREARPGRGGQGYSRDLRAHGDERRRDGGADRGRAFIWQNARRGGRGAGGPRAGSRRHRGAGPGVEEQIWHGHGRGRDHQRPGSHLDYDADPVEQQLLREPVRLRVGADQKPGGGIPVEAERGSRRGHGAGRARPVQAARADHADHRPGPAVRPGLRKDLETVLRKPGRVRGGVCAGVVQADAPRHGPALALPGARGAGRRADLARPGSGGRPRADRRGRHRDAQGRHPGLGADDLGTGFDRVGVGLHLPRLGQARRRERGARPPGAAEGLGSEPAGATGEDAGDAGEESRRRSTASRREGREFRWRT